MTILYIHTYIKFLLTNLIALAWAQSVLVTQSCLTLCDSREGSPQASPSMEFSRQESWSGLPLPSPGNLPDLRITPASPALAHQFFTAGHPLGSLYLDKGSF